MYWITNLLDKSVPVLHTNSFTSLVKHAQVRLLWRVNLSDLCVWQKIEVIDEDEEADEDGDLMVSDLEQMQNLLEFKVKTVSHRPNERLCMFVWFN